MARNVQLWTEDNRLLLDGPNATPDRTEARHADRRGRRPVRLSLPVPAMRVGRHEVLLAPPAGRVPRLPTARRASSPMPAGLPHRLPRRQAEADRTGRTVAALRHRPVALTAARSIELAHARPTTRPGAPRYAEAVRRGHSQCWAAVAVFLRPELLAVGPHADAGQLARVAAPRRWLPAFAELIERTSHRFRDGRGASAGLVHLPPHGKAVLRGAPTGRRSRCWPRGSTSTKTTPTACATR